MKILELRNFFLEDFRFVEVNFDYVLEFIQNEFYYELIFKFSADN